MRDYTRCTDEQLDAASQSIGRRLDEHRAGAREELLTIQAVRDERAKTARVDRLLAGLTPEERVALAAKVNLTQTMGVGGIASGEHVPGIG
jgi:hypothetical protein